MCYQKFKILPIALIGLTLCFNLLPIKNLDPYLYFNITKSLPRGIYLVTKKQPEVGDLVIIELPLELKVLTFNGLLLKPIIAANGDYICNKDHSIIINHQIKLAKDGRLNLYPICRNLSSDEVFLGITNKDNSLDSRYFGPILIQKLRAVVIPLITFT